MNSLCTASACLMRRPRGEGIYRRGVHGGGLALAQKALLSEAGDLLLYLRARAGLFKVHALQRKVRGDAALRSRDRPPRAGKIRQGELPLPPRQDGLRVLIGRGAALKLRRRYL